MLALALITQLQRPSSALPGQRRQWPPAQPAGAADADVLQHQEDFPAAATVKRLYNHRRQAADPQTQPQPRPHQEQQQPTDIDESHWPSAAAAAAPGSRVRPLTAGAPAARANAFRFYGSSNSSNSSSSTITRQSLAASGPLEGFLQISGSPALAVQPQQRRQRPTSNGCCGTSNPVASLLLSSRPSTGTPALRPCPQTLPTRPLSRGGGFRLAVQEVGGDLAAAACCHRHDQAAGSATRTPRRLLKVQHVSRSKAMDIKQRPCSASATLGNNGTLLRGGGCHSQRCMRSSTQEAGDSAVAVAEADVA